MLLEAVLQSISKCGVAFFFSEPHQRAHIVSFLKTELFNGEKEQEMGRLAIPIRKDTSDPACDEGPASPIPRHFFEMQAQVQ